MAEADRIFCKLSAANFRKTHFLLQHQQKFVFFIIPRRLLAGRSRRNVYSLERAVQLLDTEARVFCAYSGPRQRRQDGRIKNVACIAVLAISTPVKRRYTAE